MRQIHRTSEKLFIDFAGPTIAFTDVSRAHIFVEAMGASSYTFACATPRVTIVDWIESTVKVLHFCGGVTQFIGPDNPRAMIMYPNRYEPRANDTVLDFARHYGTNISSDEVQCFRIITAIKLAVVWYSLSEANRTASLSSGSIQNISVAVLAEAMFYPCVAHVLRECCTVRSYVI